MQHTQGTPSFFSLAPFLVFIGLFCAPPLLFSFHLPAIFSCLVAIMCALFTFARSVPFNERIAIFLSGGANTTVIAMLYIFILSSTFTHVLKLIGAIDSVVSAGLYFLPHNLVLPGLFIITSLFATAIGSSMGAIASLGPIAMGIASQLDIPPALMIGIVVGGAMLGDNLSLISDTTIAATQTTNTAMSDKFKANILLVMPAFAITLAILVGLNQWYLTSHIHLETQAVGMSNAIAMLPYGVVFMLALCGVDVILALLASIFIALIIGLAQGTFSLAQSTHLFFDGFAQDRSMQEVLVLVLFVSGLSRMVEYNGGITYLLHRLSQKSTGKASAELSIALLTFLVNAAVAINTIAILIAGPVAKIIADRAGIQGKRVASLLDIVACICQGILPYAPQLLLASSIAGVSSIAIMPYLHYQWAILVITAASIYKTYRQEKVA